MKIQVEASKLNTCEKQLYFCRKVLKRKTNELSEIMRMMYQTNDAESFKTVGRQLENQIEEIEQQYLCLLNMDKALQKVTKKYQRTEEDILRSNEVTVKQYEEKMRTVHLETFQDIKIVLRQRR